MNVKRIVYPLMILVSGFLIFNYIKSNPPQTEKSRAVNTSVDKSEDGKKSRSDKQTNFDLTVELIYPKQENFRPTIATFGEIEAVTRGRLVSQVSGEIMQVHNESAEGALFKKNDSLIRIDDRDYQIALTSAMANYASAESNLLQEKARSEQAEIDWRRLGNTEEANDLVLRKPQLLSAKSAMDSAKAGIEQAKLDIERTNIIAPYDGQIVERMVDVGQFVNRGETLLEIYATDKAEVKLPLNSQQLGLIDINNPAENAVDIYVNYGTQRYQWRANIVRTGATFNENTRQLMMIAEVEKPFNQSNDKKPSLKLGQFVQASIKGNEFENVYALPSSSVYQNSYIFVLAGDEIQQQSIEVIYKDKSKTIVAGDLTIDNVITTPLSQSQIGKMANIKDATDTDANENKASDDELEREASSS